MICFSNVNVYIPAIRTWPLARTGARSVAPEVGDGVVRVEAHTADGVVPHAAVLLRRDLVDD
jgi:hypothetical protein